MEDNLIGCALINGVIVTSERECEIKNCRAKRNGRDRSIDCKLRPGAGSNMKAVQVKVSVYRMLRGPLR
jgi:hypothetical protein